MSGPNMQVNYDSPQDIRSFWYAGTDQLEVGYGMCIDIAAAKGNLKTSLGRQVTKPATANLMHFAGFVTARVKGPAQVRLNIPNRNFIGEVFTKSDMTKDVTVLAPANGAYSLATVTDSGFNLTAVALAMETVDTSSTAANKQVRTW